jgi:hypothetical protein
MRFLLNNLVGWPCMLLGVIYAYAAMGFHAGRLCAADMMKKDLKSTNHPTDESSK